MSSVRFWRSMQFRDNVNLKDNINYYWASFLFNMEEPPDAPDPPDPPDPPNPGSIISLLVDKSRHVASAIR